MTNSKVLRLTFPEWQGGFNPNYHFGSQLLTWLAPKEGNFESAEVPVARNFDSDEIQEDGIVAKAALLKQQKAAASILKEKRPDKVITFGGDCSAEQASIDYLHGLYPEDLGLIWIDVHPDFSDPDDFFHEHAMVLGNLLGGGAPAFAELVEHPFKTKDVMYAGLKVKDLESYEKIHMENYKIAYAGPEELKENSEPVLNWIKKNNFKHIVLHWDLDVLSPVDFRSLLCNEPRMAPVEYAVGDMRLEEITRLIKDISSVSDVVGLGITEYMPWDAIRLRKALELIDLFHQ